MLTIRQQVVFFGIVFAMGLALAFYGKAHANNQTPYRDMWFSSSGTDYHITKVIDTDNGVICYFGEKEGYAIYSISCLR